MNSPVSKPLLITLDVDWAPDVAIDYAANILREHDVRSTWFITHASEAIELLKAKRDIFELGLHPNFLPGSSHGDSVEQIVENVLQLQPEATSIRTHQLVQSTPIFDAIRENTNLAADMSLFLPQVLNAQAFRYGPDERQIVRIPYTWEDDYEFGRSTPCWNPTLDFDASQYYLALDFHPIHIYLNSDGPGQYQAFRASGIPLTEATEEDLLPFRNSGEGSGTAFLRAAEFAAKHGNSITATAYGEATFGNIVRPVL